MILNAVPKEPSPLKILYVIRDPPGFGGAERQLLEISKRLVAKGHQVTILCGKTKPDLPAEEWIDGVYFRYLKLLPDGLFRFKRFSFYISRYLFYPFSLGLLEWIRDISPDILIEYVTPAPSLVYWLTRLLQLPCGAEIMEYRDRRQWAEVTDPLTAVFGYISQNLFFRHFRYQQINTISRATKQQLIHGGFQADMIKVVYGGVDCQFFRPDPAVKRDLNLLIVVGRLMPQKGHRLLLETFVQVRRQRPQAKLAIVGEGPLRSRLEAQVEQFGLTDQVIFTGKVTETEKRTWLCRAACFVMPSLQEGFGMVLLEAMACGLPLVTFDLPVFKEILNEQCGFTSIPRFNTGLMARQIVEMLSNEARWCGFSEYNIGYAKRFDWETIVRQKENHLYALARDADVLPPTLTPQEEGNHV